MRALAAILTALVIAPPAFAGNIVGDAAVLRTLDKVTATTKDYTVTVGESLTYGTLSIDVKHCEKKPPEDIPETFVFLQIFDHKTDMLDDIIQANHGDSQSPTDTVSNTPSAPPENVPETGEPLKLFSGWMLASKPAISALDHPVYDVWVIDCLKSPTP